MDILFILISIVGLGVTYKLWDKRHDYNSRLLMTLALLVVLYAICMYFEFNIGSLIIVIAGMIIGTHYVIKLLRSNKNTNIK